MKVVDSRNNAVVGMNVSITGARNLADLTNSSGCAVFAYIPAGSYHVLLNTAGWVNPSNQTAVDVTQVVSANVVNVASVQYDRAAKVGVSFETVTSSGVVPSSGWGVTAARVDDGTGSYFFEGVPAGTAQASINATSLWPAIRRATVLLRRLRVGRIRRPRSRRARGTRPPRATVTSSRPCRAPSTASSRSASRRSR